MSGTYDEIDATSDLEPQDVERFALSPEDEKKFEEWARRLVPAQTMEAF